MQRATILAPLVSLLETENGWSIQAADDGSLTFQTAEGMTMTVSPLVRDNVPGAAHQVSQAVALMCDLGVDGFSLAAPALHDLLRFNFVLTNALGGALAIRPESRTLIFSLSVSAEPELDVKGFMAHMMAMASVAKVIRERLLQGHMLCVDPVLSPGAAPLESMFASAYVVNQA